MVAIRSWARPRFGVRAVISLAIVYAVAAAALWWFLPPTPRLTLGSDGRHYRNPVFSPDGSLLADTVCETGNAPADGRRTILDVAVQLRDTADGRLRAEWPIDRAGLDDRFPILLTFSADGRRLAASAMTFRSEQTRVWEVESQRESDAFTVERDAFGFERERARYRILFAPGGRSVRMGPVKGQGFVRDAILRSDGGGRDQVLAGAAWPCALSPDGGLLMTAASGLQLDNDSALRLGNFLIALGCGQTQPWAALTAAPMAETSVSWVYSGSGGSSKQELTKAPGPPFFLSVFVPEVQLWDAVSGKRLAAWPTPKTRTVDENLKPFGQPFESRAVAFTFAPDRRTVAVVLTTYILGARNHTHAAELDTTTGQWSEPVFLMRFDTELAVARYVGGSRRLLVDTINRLTSQSFLVDFGAKSSRFICGLEAAIVAQDGSSLAFHNPDRAISSLFAIYAPPGGTNPVLAVQLDDPATDQIRDLCSIPDGAGVLDPLTYSPDGGLLAVLYRGDVDRLGAWKRTWSYLIRGPSGVRVYDVSSGRYAVVPGSSAVFSADSRTLAVTDDITVRLYDLPLRAPWLAIAGWALLPTGFVWMLGRWRTARRRKKLAAVTTPAEIVGG